MPLRDMAVSGARRILDAPILYTGRRYGCPCCGGRFRRLRLFGGRSNARCPRCGSTERHRVMMLYLERETDLFSGGYLSVLHFAPEPAIATHLAAQRNLSYLTADLDSDWAMESIDMTAIPRPDSSFDTVLVSHVLEHVPDDRAAMAELFRVLKPGGIAILQHPVDYSRPHTYEDWSLTTPEQRKHAFGQKDHVRIYGGDLQDRLADAGFVVHIRRFRQELPAALRQHYCLDEGTELDRSDDIYECRKPNDSAQSARARSHA